MVKSRRLFFWALAIAATLLALPPLLPETMAIRGKTEVSAPPGVVYQHLNDLRNWSSWSSWNLRKEMPAPQYFCGGFGTGSRVEWKDTGEDNYLQRFTLVNSSPYQFAEIAMEFPGKAVCISRISLSGDAGQTVVSWDLGMKTEGWKTLLFILNNKNTMKKSLSSLAKSAEWWHRQGFPVVEPATIDSFPYISIRRQVSRNEVSEKMGEFYDLLINRAVKASSRISGHPFAIYHSVGEESLDIECGLPIGEETEHSGIIFSGTFSETSCIITEYTGSYESLEEGHAAVRDWMEERGLKPGGPPLEIYLTDSTLADHPDKWKTRICYPVTLPCK